MAVSAAAEAAPQLIEVVGVRTAIADSSYKNAYALAKRVQEVSEGRVRVGILLEGTNAQVRLDDLKASVESASVSIPLKIATGGIVQLVADDRVHTEETRLYINKEAGTFRVKAVVFVPVLGQR